MALDHPDAVVTLTVMDIVPTYAMFINTNRKVAGYSMVRMDRT